MPGNWRFALPAGTAAAGEQAFVRRYIAHGQYRPRYLAADGTSRMGDYNDLLSVRELIDLVEFLKAIR